MQEYLLSNKLQKSRNSVQAIRNSKKRFRRSSVNTKQSLSPQQLRDRTVKRYEKQLKQFLNQNKNKNSQPTIQLTQVKEFINWNNNSISNLQPNTKSKNQQKNSRTIEYEILAVNQNKSNLDEKIRSIQFKNHKLYKFRKADQLIITRYHTPMNPNLFKRSLQRRLNQSHVSQLSNTSKTNKKTFQVKLAKLKNIKLSNQVNNDQDAFSKIASLHQKIKLQKLQLMNQSMKKYQQVSTQNANIRMLEKQKKTVFSEMSLNQEKLFQQQKQLQKLGSRFEYWKISTKQELPEFLKNYKPLDPFFNLYELAEDETKFVILHFKESIYIGLSELKDNQRIRAGKGIFMTKKSIFEGQFENNDKKYGIEQTQQGVYKGHFQNNMRNGRGEFRWKNDQYYNGQWKDNKKHGNGIWASNSSNLMNPDTYVGEWKQGKVNGYGIHTWNNGKNKYQGEFKNFLKNGNGLQFFANGDKYKGCYKDGKAQGYGEYFWNDGSFYKGYFINGIRQGKGILTQSNYDRYQGNFKNDQKHGYGKIYYSNNQVFEGNFENNVREGEGKLITLKGTILGKWKNDIYEQDII